MPNNRGGTSTPMNNPVKRYNDSLRSLPPSGGGGCHAALLSVANYGRIAKIAPSKLFEDLRAYVHGSREVTDQEIVDAIMKAYSQNGRDSVPFRPVANLPSVTQPLSDGQAARDAIVNAGRGATRNDLRDASPLAIPPDPRDQASLLLNELYQPDDMLFLGERMRAGPYDIKRAEDWTWDVKGDLPFFPLIMPNPLSGQPAPRKDGELSLRCDAAVVDFRFAIAEFDILDYDDQIAFWSSIKLPVAALIDSGRRSIHAWIRVDRQGPVDWNDNVKRKLYASLLVPMGVDQQCSNPSRLSRRPGHLRVETNRSQELLYLAPTGRAVCDHD